MTPYKFTNDWFDTAARDIWDSLVSHFNPKTILEIGSYEGAATCFLIDKLSPTQELEIHCIDTWRGGIEHQQGGSFETDMMAVEARFDFNIRTAKQQAKNKVEVVVHKKLSDLGLAELLAQGKRSYFDFIYVDGSHLAPDVLCDAVMAFKLLKVNGVMVFDDYLWSETTPPETDPMRCPKPAIDAFVNTYVRKLSVLRAPLYQLYVQKIAE
jgi:predicted O-methyltransferase YrrM